EERVEAELEERRVLVDLRYGLARQLVDDLLELREDARLAVVARSGLRGGFVHGLLHLSRRRGGRGGLRGDGSRTGSGLSHGRPLEVARVLVAVPVRAALDGMGGERPARASLARGDRAPVDAAAREPVATYRREQERRVVRVLLRMPDRRDHAVARAARG